jgi:hypothetical protein
MTHLPTWLVRGFTLGTIGRASFPPHVAKVSSPPTTTQVIDGLTDGFVARSVLRIDSLSTTFDF